MGITVVYAGMHALWEDFKADGTFLCNNGIKA
jgi:hypothetical protein